ncbi:MAG: YitT family protein [Ruminococcus sp.]|nr:YitT family protein [Ruminococcus sp.]
MDIYRLAQGKWSRGVLLVCGSVLFGLALGMILSPNRLAAGGIAGISVILDSVFPLGVGTFTFVLNIPLLFCAYRVFGRRFVLSTAAAIAVCALSADCFARLDTPITDPLLAAVFGGALMGLGCGAVFLSGATTGGTDIVTKLILRKKPHFSTGKVFLAIDGSVCIAGGIVFKSLSNALYAFIGLFVFSKMLDAVLYGGNSAKLVLIVTKKADALLPQLLSSANVGCTVISARAGYTGSQASTLMCAIKKHRLHAVRTLAVRTDSEAFILVLDTNEIYGNGFQPLEVRDKK